MKIIETNKIKVFTSVRRVEGQSSYRDHVFHLMKRNEELGFNGILFFENHSNDLEPWVFAQELFSKTRNQHPFIAVNPAYVHPYSAALKIISLSNLYNRKLYLNYIVGTSKSDLESIEGKLSHAQRYERLKEYMLVVDGLLKSSHPFSFNGSFYSIRNVKLPTSLAADLHPECFISGSSVEANAVRQLTGAAKITMAKPLAKCGDFRAEGLCFGVLARAHEEEARDSLAQSYAPEFPEYKEVLEYSLYNTDAVWKKELKTEDTDNTFRLEPFKNFVSDSPYLVGSHMEVAGYIHEYIKMGVHTFIIEADDIELEHVVKVFEKIPCF